MWTPKWTRIKTFFCDSHMVSFISRWSILDFCASFVVKSRDSVNLKDVLVQMTVMFQVSNLMTFKDNRSTLQNFYRIIYLFSDPWHPLIVHRWMPPNQLSHLGFIKHILWHLVELWYVTLSYPHGPFNARRRGRGGSIARNWTLTDSYINMTTCHRATKSVGAFIYVWYLYATVYDCEEKIKF